MIVDIGMKRTLVDYIDLKEIVEYNCVHFRSPVRRRDSRTPERKR